MIPGVLKGVIASSWLRASDQLRAPNAITTGQEIPYAYFEVRSHFATEFWLATHMAGSVMQNPGVRAALTLAPLLQRNQPLRLKTATLCVIKKVA